jgi:hypothetical protein
VTQTLPHSWRRSLGVALRLALAFLPPLLLAVAILRLAPQMAPVQEGSVDLFWNAAFHWEKGPPAFSGAVAVGLWKNWFIYERQNMHGSDLHRVPEGEVNAGTGQALRRLEQEVARDAVPGFVVRGFRSWQQGQGGPNQDLPALLAAIEEARLDEWRERDRRVFDALRQKSQATEERLRGSDGYWATQLFEWAFLSALALLVLWPLLRPCGKLQRALHWGLAPVLFFLPLYLGYATYTFTSRGPSGGVLYPWLVAQFRNRAWPIFPWDRPLAALLPPLRTMGLPIG